MLWLNGFWGAPAATFIVTVEPVTAEGAAEGEIAGATLGAATVDGLAVGV